MKFKHCLCLAAAVCAFQSIHAGTITVSSTDELKEAVSNLQPGSTVKLTEGIWKDVEVTISGIGTASEPILVEAVEHGKTIFTGPTAIRLDGEFIHLRGFKFHKATNVHGDEPLVSFRNESDEESSHCRVSHSEFVDCNPDDHYNNYSWIQVFGHNNRVDHCRFSGQVHKGRAVQLKVYQTDAGHRIDHNYFVDRKPGLESNEYEVIQAGNSGESMNRGNIVMEDNIFNRCDGETEIISSKTWDNVIRRNLFLDSSGTVTLRHGDEGVVEKNVFFGKNKAASGGVRVVGRDNIISGNYFTGLTGRTGASVVLYCGIPDSPLNGYFSADRTLLKDNFFYRNSGNLIHLNGGFGTRNRVILPEDVQLVGNVFGPSSTTGNVTVVGHLSDLKTANNLYRSGSEMGLPRQDGFQEEEFAFMENGQGLREPYLVTEGKRSVDPILEAPELVDPSMVGPAWSPVLPELLLINGNRLLLTSVERSNSVLADAESIISAGNLYSVTDNERVPPSGNIHDYYSTGPYWWPNPDTPDGLPYIRIDGKFNPERDLVSDRAPLLSMIHDVQVLAQAHVQSGDDRFAAWGATILRTWFLDEKTYMRPNLNHAQAIPGINTGRGTGIIDTHPFAELVDALLIISHSGYLTETESTDLKKWFSTYADWLLESQHGRHEKAAANNHGTAFDLQIAALLWYTGREDELRNYLETYSLPRIGSQITPEGQQPEELRRTRTWSYCTENLEHFFKLGLIARKVGLDIFGYHSESGSSIKQALDFLLPYVCQPEQWPHEQKTAWQDEYIQSVLSIATQVYPGGGYREALQCLSSGNLHAWLIAPNGK